MSIFARLNPFNRTDTAPRVRQLDAATGGRRGGGLGSFGPINPEIGVGAALTRSRARYLAHNNPFLNNGVSNWAAALVGTGIRPTARSDDADSRCPWIARALA